MAREKCKDPMAEKGMLHVKKNNAHADGTFIYAISSVFLFLFLGGEHRER